MRLRAVAWAAFGAFNSKPEAGVARDRDRAVAGYARARELAATDDMRKRACNALGLEWIEVQPIDLARAEDAFFRGIAAGDRFCAENLANALEKFGPQDIAAQQRINAL